MTVQLDELRLFLTREPPRPVPRFIRKEALRRYPAGIIVMGMIFGLFGVPFLIGFFPWRLVDDLRLRASAQTATDAVVTARNETAMSENDRKVFRYEFLFTPPDGVTRSGVCYRTGGDLNAGEAVRVEYLPHAPDIARIRGCRLSRFGWGAAFVVIFPGVGFAMVYLTLRARRRLVALLRDGRFSAGKIGAVESTNVRVNNQPRYRVSVTFKTDFEERSTRYFAYGEDAALAEAKRAQGTTVGLLYDPSDPARVFLVDELLD